MNEEINWEEAPEGYDLHVSIQEISCSVRDFAKDLGNGYCRFTNGKEADINVCKEFGVVTERPPQEEPPLRGEYSIQDQLSQAADLLYSLSWSIECQTQQQTICNMVSQLLDIHNEYRQAPEQRLRAKVWDVVAETDIRESDIDSITTDIIEKFNLEEK